MSASTISTQDPAHAPAPTPTLELAAIVRASIKGKEDADQALAELSAKAKIHEVEDLNTLTQIELDEALKLIHPTFAGKLHEPLKQYIKTVPQSPPASSNSGPHVMQPIQLKQETAAIMSKFLQLTHLPKTFDETTLQQMLDQPLSTKIYSMIPTQNLEEEKVFQYSNECCCPHLESLVRDLLSGAYIPSADASEMLWSGYWDSVILHFIEIAKRLALLQRVKFQQNVQDGSSTYVLLKRDFLLWLHTVLVVAGEDKPTTGQAAEAEEELKTKTLANTALYGQSTYFFGFTTAGSIFELFAIVFEPDETGKKEEQSFSVCPLKRRFDISQFGDRLPFFIAIVNLCHWIHTVEASDMLDTLALPLNEPQPRINPYTFDKTTIIINKGYYIEKTMKIPVGHIATFEKVYCAITKINSKNHVRLKDVKVLSSATAKGKSRIQMLGCNFITKSRCCMGDIAVMSTWSKETAFYRN